MDNLKARTMADANKITDQIIDDVLCACFEGGSNFWAERVAIKTPATGARYASETPSRGGVLTIEAEDDPTVYELDRAKIEKGIEAAAVHFGQTIEKFYDNHDAESADAALQFAIFGELVFG